MRIRQRSTWRPDRPALPSCDNRVKMRGEIRALGAGLATLALLGACAQPVPPATDSAPTALVEAIATAGAAVDPRFNPTAAAGGGINASNAITADDIATIFKAIPQANQLKLEANSSPPGARGSDVQTVSVIAQDTGGVLKGLDATAKRALGDGLLTAAGTAWPNASVSLLVSDPAGAGGQIIGSRAAGGTNTVIVV